MEPACSVVICTYNPDRALLAEVLDALARQDAPPPFELVLVDNNSEPAVEASLLSGFGDRARVIREPRQGLANARACGIAETRSELLVFVDDDNILASDYLRHCARIAEEEPGLGVFAGRSVGRFARPPGWLHRRNIARFAVRDLGDEPLTGSGAKWGIWEPFGAGMAVRRDIAEAFADMNEIAGGALPLGRSGAAPATGEDSLFSRIADRLGYQVGYRPQLRLEHAIAEDRLSLKYLLKLIEGQGRSHAILEAMCGRMEAQPAPKRFGLLLARRFLHRLRNPGPHEAFTHLWWDYGFYTERADVGASLHQALRRHLDRLAGGDASSGGKGA